jgi:hypothetical protein
MKARYQFFVGFAFVLLLWHFPLFFWLAYQVGILDARVGDVRVVTQNEWVPAPHWFWRMINPKGIPPEVQTTALILKITAFQLPWKQMAFITKNSEYDEAKLTPEVASLKDYSWGRAYVIRPEVSKLKEETFIVIPKYNVTVLTPDSTILNDIKNIEPIKPVSSGQAKK